MDIKIKWHDNANDEAQQRIYAASSPQGTKVLLATVGADVTEATVTIPEALRSGPVYFTVTAQNASGESQAVAWHVAPGATIDRGDVSAIAKHSNTVRGTHALPAVTATAVAVSKLLGKHFQGGGVNSISPRGEFYSINGTDTGIQVLMPNFQVAVSVPTGIDATLSYMTGVWDDEGNYWYSPPQSSPDLEMYRIAWDGTTTKELTFPPDGTNFNGTGPTVWYKGIAYWIRLSNSVIKVTLYDTKANSVGNWEYPLDTTVTGLNFNTKLYTLTEDGQVVTLVPATVNNVKKYFSVAINLNDYNGSVYELTDWSEDRYYSFADPQQLVYYDGYFWFTAAKTATRTPVLVRVGVPDISPDGASLAEWTPPAADYTKITEAPTNAVLLLHGEIALGCSGGENSAFLWLFDPAKSTWRTAAPAVPPETKGGFNLLLRSPYGLFQCNYNGEQIQYNFATDPLVSIAPALQVLNYANGTRQHR